MAVTRARNSGIKTGVLKYDSMLGGYPPVMAAPTATAGVESASVAFTAVSGISTYRAISTPGSITATGSASPISVTGLTAGTGYTFQIRAENSVGNGAYSAASNSVTPTAATAFESIASQTLSTNTATVTFSSIPSTYKHLQIRFIGRFSDSGTAIDWVYIQFNGVTSNSYARHYLSGDGASVTASGAASTTQMSAVNSVPYNGNTANIFGAGIIDVHDYASTTRNKTIRAFSGCDKNGVGGYVNLSSGFINSTSAVTSISLFGIGVNWVAGSTFALYGIKG